MLIGGLGWDLIWALLHTVWPAFNRSLPWYKQVGAYWWWKEGAEEEEEEEERKKKKKNKKRPTARSSSRELWVRLFCYIITCNALHSEKRSYSRFEHAETFDVHQRSQYYYRNRNRTWISEFKALQSIRRSHDQMTQSMIKQAGNLVNLFLQSFNQQLNHCSCCAVGTEQLYIRLNHIFSFRDLFHRHLWHTKTISWLWAEGQSGLPSISRGQRELHISNDLQSNLESYLQLTTKAHCYEIFIFNWYEIEDEIVVHQHCNLRKVLLWASSLNIEFAHQYNLQSVLWCCKGEVLTWSHLSSLRLFKSLAGRFWETVFHLLLVCRWANFCYGANR